MAQIQTKPSKPIQIQTMPTAKFEIPVGRHAGGSFVIRCRYETFVVFQKINGDSYLPECNSPYVLVFNIKDDFSAKDTVRLICDYAKAFGVIDRKIKFMSYPTHDADIARNIVAEFNVKKINLGYLYCSEQMFNSGIFSSVALDMPILVPGQKSI